MKLVPALLATAALACATLAQAHAPMHASTPADGATVPPPSAFTLTFAHPVRLTQLALRPVGGEAKPVPGLARELAAEHTVKAPALTPGRYELDWRAAAGDGHVMSGTIHFSVAAAAPAATAGATPTPH